MVSTAQLNVDALKSFTDVVYLDKKQSLPSDTKKLLQQHRLSYKCMSIEELLKMNDHLHLVGTVIVDACSLDSIQKDICSDLVEVLERENIGAVVLSQSSEGLSVTSIKSYISGNRPEVVTIDDLWSAIAVNLAYKKKTSGFILNQAGAKDVSSESTDVTDELGVTEALIDNLAEQLRLAGMVQRDFLTTKLPNSDKLQWAAMFLPAEWVSGDIYNVERVDERHIGFYVADVVGHGIPAALLTIFLKQALTMRATYGNTYKIFPPSQVMADLNKKMAGQKLSGYQFATCCYCLLNFETLEMTFSRAGHPYPVLIRDGKPQQLEVRGALLGIFEQAEFFQTTVQLQRGDKILIYSDGAEPFIGKGNEAGGFEFNQKFTQMLSLPIVELIDSFNDLVKKTSVSLAEFDDVTALGLQIL